MFRLQPWLVLRSWAFTSWKTSWSVANWRSFDPFRQINIFNQPTGYSHLEIWPPSDLVDLVWDIYYYNLYYNSYNEKMELLALYKKTLQNLEDYEYKDLFPRANNLVKSHKFFSDIFTNIKIFLWILPSCVLSPYQAQKHIDEIENDYLPKRQKYVEKYGDDLLLNYFFYLSLDELQLYFGTRAFAVNFAGENAFLVDFICFPVKLNTRIEWIVQNEQMLDVFFRRQASSYLRSTARFLWLIKKQEEFQPRDTEKVRIDDSDVLKTSTSINFYKIFGIPKLQYYRNHLINSKSPKIYKRWLLFEYIRDMTNKYYSVYPSRAPALPAITTTTPST